MVKKTNKGGGGVLKKRASVSMHPEVWQAVKDAAKEEGRSVSNYLQALLVKQLELKI